MSTDRILKLIRLAKNNPSPEEAAVAFAQAQTLALRQGLQIDDLLAAAIEEQAPATPREVGAMACEAIDRWDRAIPWKLTIAQAVLRANMCKCAISTGHGGGIQGYGSPEHLATARYVYLAIVREVDQLAQAAVARQSAHFDTRGEATIYGRSWRLGCAHEIDSRMPDPGEEIEASRREVDGARQRALMGDHGVAALAQATHALVRVNQAEDYLKRLTGAVDAFYDEHVKGRSVSYQGARDHGAYAAGRRAGQGVDLGSGKGRRALGR